MVLYIDFEWETEPLKMALSKNFTLPEKCKNQRSAPTVQCWSVFSDSKLFGSSLISQRDWRGPLLAPPPGPAPAGTRSETARQFLWRTFKFTSNEEEKKATKRKTKRHTEWKSLCHFFSKKTCFPIKISVFWLFVSFWVCFSYECSCMSFSHWFFFFFFCPYTPLPHRLTPPSPHPPTHPPKSSRREAISQWGHMHKKDKNKNWRTSVGGSGGEPLWSGELEKDIRKKLKWRDEGRRTLTLYHLKGFFVFVFVWDATETC